SERRRTLMQRPVSVRVRAFGVACSALACAGVAGMAIAPAAATGSKRAGPAASSFIGKLHKIRTIASAVPRTGPAKGDANPYGVAVVPTTKGSLIRGDVLVSNFNDMQNQQGTGSSIVQISPTGTQSVFAVVPRPTSAPAVGLTTALVALKRGFVIVGNLPAPG